MENKKIYNLAQAYWGRMIRSVAREKGLSFQHYLNPYDGAGLKEYDANPSLMLNGERCKIVILWQIL